LEVTQHKNLEFDDSFNVDWFRVCRTEISLT